MLWSLALLGGCLEKYEEDTDDTDVVEEILPQMVGPAGGTFDFGGSQIVVPEGAVPSPIEFRFYETADDPPDGYAPLSKVWRAEPEAYVFSVPIIIRIPYGPADAERPMMFWSNDEGGYDRVLPAYTSDAGGLIWANIEHFSTGFVATLPVETVEVTNPYPPADVLFVVDNSCSMEDEQLLLADAMPGVLPSLQATGLDFHLGVVSTDLEEPTNAGKLIGAQGYRFIDSATVDPDAVFAEMALLGTLGWYEEKGRAAAFTVLELQPDIPRNVDFLRDDATLSIVFVSDEDDQSGADPVTRPEFVAWMETKKARPQDVVAHGFIDPPNQACVNGAGPGTEYAQAINATGGVLANLCAPDWTPALQDMFDRLLDSARVALPTPGTTIERVVFVNGATETELSPADYTWDDTLDTVFFDRGVRPGADDTVRVVYVPE
ncbi:MAG: hypothetical protein R3F61_08275 [Myxococcota bacterium]